MLIPIVNNISLLVTISVAYLLLSHYFDQSTKRVQFLSGILFGAFVILGIYNSVEFQEGLIFDGRSIILSIAGLFGGPITAITAFVMALAYRILIGGAGALVGSLVIVEATVLGILFHYLVRNRKFPRRWLYLIMGFLVHFIMIILMLLLPGDVRFDVIATIVLPVMVIYPIASFLVCMLFHSQHKYLTTVKDLTESKGRFRQLFYESQMVYLVIDPVTKNILDANKVAQDYYGYSIDELKSMKISQINILPEEEINLRINLAFEKIQNRFVMHHKLASGEVRDVEVFAGPVDYAGKTYLYSIVSDITDRMKIENRLRESELSYRGLFDAVNDAIYIQNREGVFLDMNIGAEKMYGYKREEIIGKSPSFLGAPDLNDPKLLLDALEKAFQGQETGFEYWGKRKNGEIFPKYVRLYKGIYFGEEVVIAIGHDITHRKKAQKEIEESRFNLNALINVSDDIIVLLDDTGNIITHNKTFADFYQTKGEYIGRNIFKIFPSDIAEDRLKYFENVVETCKPISFEDFSFEKDWWISYYPILNKQAKVDRVALYARDITVQRKMFSLQKNLQVAEKSAQMKQQFLSNMSHEMRTPMNGIIGMAGLLEKSDLNDIQRDYLNTIQESSNTLLALINDILDLARFESGKMPIVYQNVSIRDFEQKIVNLFKQTAIEKGLGFHVDFSDDLPGNIVTDEKRLTQIIINLLGNALKFTHSGSISVKAELIGKKGNMRIIKFMVEDTGIGIDRDYITSIFDEFAQLDNSKTRQYEGSGLGLAISKKIVDLLGGEIGVDSEKGKGSNFWFTIKAEESEMGKFIHKEIKKGDYPPLGLKVLMVEDKIINRKVANLILKNMGCFVETAENGLIGIDKVMNNHFDVILMDIQMPVMDGITAVKTIRKSKKKQPHIIGLSAEAMEGDAEKYIQLGMDDYLTKPLVPDLLYEKLSALVEKKG
jgi:PAS domain S-box-containing protein